MKIKYPHRSREAMIQHIIYGVGGYRDRLDRWPLEFSVGAYHVSLDLEDMWRDATPDDLQGLSDATSDRYRQAAEAVFEDLKNSLFTDAVDQAREVLDMLLTEFYVDDYKVVVDYQLRGQGGKHFVVDSLRSSGMELGLVVLAGMSDDDLFDMLCLQEDADGVAATTYTDKRAGYILLPRHRWVWSTAQVRHLYHIVRHLAARVNCEAASAEVQYQGRQLFYMEVEDKYAELVAEADDHEALVEAAQQVHNVLKGLNMNGSIAALLSLARAAGLTDKEVKEG